MTLKLPYIINNEEELEIALKIRAVKQYTWARRIVRRSFLRTSRAEAQNWKCCYCGCNMSTEAGKKHSATLEHVLPVSKGGTDDPSNLVAACSHCNGKRGNKDICLTEEEFGSFKTTIGFEVKKVKTLAEQHERSIYSYSRRLKKLANRENFDFPVWLNTLKMTQSGIQILTDTYASINITKT